ncbi:hypothetical protein TWF788_006710 [Orbilia oligospora]|uniref:Methyltransferase domain-containing protein n=1 Tax=Orbilia oligospora TaxID=2813651 RepID=A0A7C8TTU4_ORBOL|nr:hypothetical protein TWF788_006710 [Orbilia oligospora]KAF3206255.1 hypothetical protein TWF679_008777 [Orbilia oligospora]
MPRICRKILKELRSHHKLLPLLYRENRIPELAKFELRHLQDHVLQRSDLKHSPRLQFKLLKSLCERRARAEPLDHILGTTQFDDLEILSGKGALIPRPETEAMVLRLCDALKDYHFVNEKRKQNLGNNFRVLDLCTGAGPIALLMAKQLYEMELPYGHRVLGIDVSEPALKLATRSLEYNIGKGLLPTDARRDVGFCKGNVLDPEPSIYGEGGDQGLSYLGKSGVHDDIKSFFGSEDQGDYGGTLDILIANPPYVSANGYWEDTERSVRLYEPEIALVPPEKRPENVSDNFLREDFFYPAIEEFAAYFKSKAIVFETGGDKQSGRVKAMLESRGWETGTWKDFRGIQRNVVGWRKETGWNWLLLPSKNGMSYD